MKINHDFEEFFASLNENEVRYVVIGGYAYAVHAEPRYTKDLDIYYDDSAENANKILDALEDFGFGSLSVTVDDLIAPGKIIQMGNPPFRIDLLNEIDGVSFKEAWDTKITASYGNEDIFVIGKQALIKNKKAVGRKQDLLDAERLEE